MIAEQTQIVFQLSLRDYITCNIKNNEQQQILILSLQLTMKNNLCVNYTHILTI